MFWNFPLLAIQLWLYIRIYIYSFNMYTWHTFPTSSLCCIFQAILQHHAHENDADSAFSFLSFPYKRKKKQRKKKKNEQPTTLCVCGFSPSPLLLNTSFKKKKRTPGENQAISTNTPWTTAGRNKSPYFVDKLKTFRNLQPAHADRARTHRTVTHTHTIHTSSLQHQLCAHVYETYSTHMITRKWLTLYRRFLDI